jgi:hypothetical protein
MKRLSDFYHALLLSLLLILVSFTLSFYFSSGVNSAPRISGSPDSIIFGEVRVGSASAQRSVTIKNVGRSDLAIDSVNLTGPNASEFSQINNCDRLQAGDSCTVTVVFMPTNSFGRKKGLLGISSNDPQKPVFTLKLSGDAPAPSISASPVFVNFGEINLGSASSTKTIRIRNTGKGVLNISSVDISGINDSGEFSQSNNCSTMPIPYGEACVVTLVFTPSIPFGRRSVTMRIASNDPKRATVNVQLFGMGSPQPGLYSLSGTGQKTCYDGAGDIILCPPPGNPLTQDGSYNTNPLLYAVNLNRTMTDNNTGLMWQQEDDGQARTWNQAMSYCDSLTLGGYSDWRLPSKKELHSIVNYGVTEPGPIIDGMFINTKTDYYWSSTAFTAYPGTAWAVNFYSGYISYNIRGTNYYVRCVRGEQLPSQRFIDNGDSTVTDNTAGLMWQQGEDTPMSWEAALSHCTRLSLGGHSDWRLPNIKELESSTDDTQYDPSIDTVFFPGAQPSYYWSSTTNARSTNNAWYLNFKYGSVGGRGNKLNSYNVRCVRSGY